MALNTYSITKKWQISPGREHFYLVSADTTMPSVSFASGITLALPGWVELVRIL